MSLLRRRIMIESAKRKEPNGFIPGDYYSKIDSYKCTVNPDGSITATTRLCYFVLIPIKEPIAYKSGDAITFAQDRSYTSLIGFRTVRLNKANGLIIVDNKSLNNYAEFSVTANADGTINAIYFGNSSAAQSGTAKPIIKINDVTVIGG